MLIGKADWVAGLGTALVDVDTTAAATEDDVEILIAETGEVVDETGAGAGFHRPNPDMAPANPAFQGD